MEINFAATRDQLATIKRSTWESEIQNNLKEIIRDRSFLTDNHRFHRESDTSSCFPIPARKLRDCVAAQTSSNFGKQTRRGEEKFFSLFSFFFFFFPLTKMDRSKSPNPKLRGGNRKRRRVGGELNSRTIPGRAASGNERERIRRVCRLQPRFRVSNGARPRSRKPR